MIIYGKNPVFEYLENRKNDIKELFTCEKKLKQVIENKYKIQIKLLDKKNFISKLKNKNVVHQNIIADIELPNIFSIENLIVKFFESSKQTILILDHIEDPHNFGAIIRNAAFFDVFAIILSNKRQISLNSTVVKTSSGMTSMMNFCIVSNINNAISKLKENGFWSYSAVVDEKSILPENIDVSSPIALIVGSEGGGIHNNIRNNSDFFVKIQGNKKVNSLNVSVATSILLYQIYENQRNN